MVCSCCRADDLNRMANEQFNVAIIGAGIGGLALAIGLSHRKIPFTIYESAPAFSTVGAGVGLGPNSLRAMDLIDTRFREMYMEIATGNLLPEKKHVMMEAMRMEKGLGEGESWWGRGEWGAPYFERTGAHRKDLLDIMTSFIDRGVICFGRAITGIEQRHDQVGLTFADGQKAYHAAAIGCDGIKGLTRRVVLGHRYPEYVEPRYTQKYVYRAVLEIEQAKEILGDLATDAKMYMGKNSNLSTYPISKGKQINVVAFRRDSSLWEHDENTQIVEKETMLEDFADVTLDDRLLKLLEVSFNFYGGGVAFATKETIDRETHHGSLQKEPPQAQLSDIFFLSSAHQADSLGHLRPRHHTHLLQLPGLSPRRCCPRKHSPPRRRRRPRTRRRAPAYASARDTAQHHAACYTARRIAPPHAGNRSSVPSLRRAPPAAGPGTGPHCAGVRRDI